MNPNFIKKLGFRIRETKISTQKINSSKLDIFGMVIAVFSMKNKEKRSHFFEKIFILAEINIDIILNISFLTLSNVKIDFIDRHIYWKSYTVVKVFLITRQIELIGNKEFAVVVLNLEDKAFVIHIASISLDWDVYPS